MPAVSRISAAADWLLKLPLIWGALACLAFYCLLMGVGNSTTEQYFGVPGQTDLGNVVKLTITSMFFVGATALVMRLGGLAGQFTALQRRVLDPKPEGGHPVEDAELLVEQLDRQPVYLQDTYLVRRLRDAIDHVRRTASADSLQRELRRLEDADLARMSSGYGLTRIVIWAIPILGFLGTVIGITIAIRELNPDPKALEASLQDVTRGLSVAFDTTAVALALSMVLMFFKFFVERVEERVLAAVDERVNSDLVGRFQQYGGGNDPMAASVHRMCDQVVRAVETMAARQADLWAEAISETHSQWANVTSATSETLQETLTQGLREGLRDHATGLTQGVESQLAALNDRLGAQTDAFASSLEGGMRSLTTSVGEEVATLRSAVAEQVAALNASVEQHGARLEHGAETLLGNLRTGLERMAELLVEALERHGDALTHAEEELASENRRHLSEVEAALGEAMVLSADRQEKLIGRSETLLRDMQNALVDAAGATVAHQEQLVKQGEVLLKVVDATGQVRELESALSNNLETLGRTHNLEETLLSLSASIQLLSARVSGPKQGALSPHSDPKSHAA